MDRASTRKLSVLLDLDCCRPRRCLVIFVWSPQRSLLFWLIMENLEWNSWADHCITTVVPLRSVVFFVAILWRSFYTHNNGTFSDLWLSTTFTSTSSLSRVTPPTPFPLVNGLSTKGVYFIWLNNLNSRKLGLIKFPWERNAHNIAESRVILYRNKIINLSTQMPNWISIIRFSQLIWKLSRLEGLGKSERFEGQESFLTAGRSADTLLMFGYIMNFMIV